MIWIAGVSIAGRSTAGDFEGRLSFEPGLFVVSADNHFGKSLAVTAIAWCLGLEPMFGVRDDDVTCFPIAAHEAIDLDDTRRSAVQESHASLELVRDDGERITIIRPIVGNTKEVTVQRDRPGEESRTVRLVARYHAMKDEAGGLQNFLFEWMRLPRTRVLSFRGNAGELYLENLAPHFYIDQREGWTNIQALQVHRYGLVDIEQVTVEFLIGADEALGARVRMQEIAAKEAQLKAEAVLLSTQVQELFASQGWTYQPSSHGSVVDIAKRWERTTIKAAAKDEFNFDLIAEQRRLAAQADSLREVLSNGNVDDNNQSAASDLSQTVVNLKAERHSLREELHRVRLQHSEQASLGVSILHRINAARDVLRLKVEKIGRLEVVECPTCHRHIDPSTFNLTSHSTATVEAHVEALKRDQALVADNVESAAAHSTRLVARLASVEERLRMSERSLTNINLISGAIREQFAKAAIDLSAIEREQEKNLALSEKLDELQQRINAWVRAAQGQQGEESSKGDLNARLTAFEDSLRMYLIAFGHKGVPYDEIHLVHLDADYIPYFETRRIRALGSASDNARLIASYALALADTSHKVHGHHPGFVIFDEPLQQNPDPDHRALFLRFLETVAAAPLPCQLIVFTTLEPAEVNQLKAAGVRIDAKTKDDVHLLKHAKKPHAKAALYEALAREAVPWIERRSVVIYGITDLGNAVPDGSGVLLQVADAHFVLTAAHVLEDWGTRYYALSLGALGYVDLTSLTAWISDEDNGDTAMLQLTDEMAERVLRSGKDFVQLTETDPHGDEPPAGLHAVLGYPKPLAKSDGDGGWMSDAIWYPTTLAPALNSNPDFDIVLEIDVENVDAEGHRARLPYLGGISGCGIWRLQAAETKPEEWSANDIRLVGLEHHVVGKNEGIKGTRIRHVLVGIADRYPELAPAIARAFSDTEPA